MKLLVGKRDVVDPGMKAMMLLVEFCCLLPRARTATVISYPGFCKGCKTPTVQTLSEDVNTGEIWAEGADFCEKCGFRLSAENPNFLPLSQEAIVELFGGF